MHRYQPLKQLQHGDARLTQTTEPSSLAILKAPKVSQNKPSFLQEFTPNFLQETHCKLKTDPASQPNELRQPKPILRQFVGPRNSRKFSETFYRLVCLGGQNRLQEKHYFLQGLSLQRKRPYIDFPMVTEIAEIQTFPMTERLLVENIIFLWELQSSLLDFAKYLWENQQGC